MIVDLYLNQQHMGDTFVLHAEDGRFYIEESILNEWQITKPWPKAKSFRGNRYYAVNEFAGADTSFNTRRMELQVFMPASLMPMRTIDLQIEEDRALVEDVGELAKAKA